MSATVPIDTPKDILDKNLPINSKYVEYDRRLERAFVINDCTVCTFCQWQSSADAKACERCSRTLLASFEKGAQLGLQADGVSAHARRQVKVCPSYSANMTTGQRDDHNLDEKTRPVVNPATLEWHVETYCGSCGTAFTWSEGRSATTEEMVKFREGKIRAPERRKVMGRGNSIGGFQ